MPQPLGTDRRLSKNRCSNLRWKGLYIDASCNPDDHYSNDSAMWCQQTFQIVGPDGRIVDEFECSPARECYDPL